MSFYCEDCNYAVNHRGDWKKHLSTKKHKMNYNNKISEMNESLICVCGRTFSYSKNFQRHKERCLHDYKHINEIQEDTFSNAIKTLVKENKKLYEQIKNIVVAPSETKCIDNDENTIRTIHTTEVNVSETNSIVKHNMMTVVNTKQTNNLDNTITHQTINNYGDYKPQYITAIKDSQINMKVYLDKHCSQAINLKSFIENLRINNEDLDETRESGLAYSLGKVMLRGLRELEMNKRPIHCGDLRKSIMYIRDNDAWDVDRKETQLRNAISILSSKQILQIKEWEKEHPDWDKTDKGKQIYAETVHKMLSAANDDSKEKIEKQVIKTIAKETLLKEANTSTSIVR